MIKKTLLGNEKFNEQMEWKSDVNNLCSSLLIGPKWPNPDAMVFISTCFQQQYGRSLSLSAQHDDSNIKSERNNPNDMDWPPYVSYEGAKVCIMCRECARVYVNVYVYVYEWVSELQNNW